MVYIYTTLHIARQHITINLNCIIWLRSPATCGGVPFDGGSKVTLKWPGPSKHAYLPLRPMPPLHQGARHCPFICLSLVFTLLCVVLWNFSSMVNCYYTAPHCPVIPPPTSTPTYSPMLLVIVSPSAFLWILVITCFFLVYLSLPHCHCLTACLTFFRHCDTPYYFHASRLVVYCYLTTHFNTILHCSTCYILLHNTFIVAHYIETQLKLRSRRYAIVSFVLIFTLSVSFIFLVHHHWGACYLSIY